MGAEPGAFPWTRTADGVRLTVRLTPRAGRKSLGGVRTDDRGSLQMLARVTVPPVDGGANAALIELVAQSLGVAKSAVVLVSGQTSRVKTLAISGDPTALAAKLRALSS